MFKQIKKTRYIVIIASVIVILGLLFVFLRSGSSTTSATTVVAKTGTIKANVSVTGRVKSSLAVNLGFEKSGTVASVPVAISDKVYRGQVLLSLNSADTEASLLQAEANVKAESAKLLELQRGTRTEEVDLSKLKVQNASTSLSNALVALNDAITQAYIASDDAVRSKSDALFDYGTSPNPQLKYSFRDTTPKQDLEKRTEEERLLVEELLVRFESRVKESRVTGSISQDDASTARSELITVRNFLDDVVLVVNSLVSNSALSQTQIDKLKTDLSSARNGVTSASATVASAYDAFTSASSNLAVLKNQLGIQLAGSVEEQILAQEARVEAAQANVLSYKAQVAKGIIYAPFDGVVTKQEGKVGQFVAPNATLVSLMSNKAFEIEVNVPEVDIGKISLQSPVSITLDAFTDETFTGHVSAIEPAETIVDGVVNFKVTVLFDGANDRLKSGLTANLEIETEHKDNVVIVPQTTIIENDNGAFVQKMVKGKAVETKVVLGIRGESGDVEIKEGVREGDVLSIVGLKK